MNIREFGLHVSGYISLSVAEIWPDGDAPANPTAADVAARMEESLSLWSVIHDWNLADDLLAEVEDGNMSVALFAPRHATTEDTAT